jgi:ATP-dependent RNA helicase DDX46/PRP5
VAGLELVVNYDAPSHYEEYVHRVGRTGRAGRKGLAVTFISEEEERYAPDLVRALDRSGQAVPEDLKALADSFTAKVKQGTEQTHASGYGGTGFKFNEEEEAARRAARKAQAMVHYRSSCEEEQVAARGDMAKPAAVPLLPHRRRLGLPAWNDAA